MPQVRRRRRPTTARRACVERHVETARLESSCVRAHSHRPYRVRDLILKDDDKSPDRAMRSCSRRKRMLLVMASWETRTIVKGAPEDVLELLSDPGAGRRRSPLGVGPHEFE